MRNCFSHYWKCVLFAESTVIVSSLTGNNYFGYWPTGNPEEKSALELSLRLGSVHVPSGHYSLSSPLTLDSGFPTSSVLTRLQTPTGVNNRVQGCVLVLLRAKFAPRQQRTESSSSKSFQPTQGCPKRKYNEVWTPYSRVVRCQRAKKCIIHEFMYSRTAHDLFIVLHFVFITKLCKYGYKATEEKEYSWNMLRKKNRDTGYLTTMEQQDNQMKFQKIDNLKTKWNRRQIEYSWLACWKMWRRKIPVGLDTSWKS